MTNVFDASVGSEEVVRAAAADAPPSNAVQETTPAASEGVSASYVWYVVLLLSVVNIFNYMDRMALSVLMPFIKVELRLSDGQLGLLAGFAFFLFYAICGIPIARWADRGNRRNIIAITLTIWSVMTALSGAAQNFWQLLLARVALAAGEAGCIPSGESLISDYVPMRRRSGVYAIYGFGMSVGSMVGMVLAGGLSETIGWRWTFVVMGLPGIAVALLVRLTLREPRRGASDNLRDDQGHKSLRVTIAALYRCRTYRLVVLFYVMNGFAYVGLLQWWPSFYARVFGLSSFATGTYLGLAIGAGSGLGVIIGGLVAQRAARRDVRLPITVGTIAIALALPAALGSLFAASSMSSLLLALVAITLWSVPSGPMTAILYSVTEPRTRATAGALAIFFISVLGFGLGPLAVGLLSDALAPFQGAESLRYALLLPVSFLTLMIITLQAVVKALPDDLRAAGITVAMTEVL